MPPIITILIILVLLFILARVILGIYSAYIDKKYLEFILEHSLAVREMRELNEQYHFTEVAVCSFRHEYDNRHYFDMISTEDYLIYQLNFRKKEVLREIKNAESNKRLFSVYEKRVAGIATGRFDTTDLPKDTERLDRLEKKRLDSMTKRPITDYHIDVVLRKVDQNGNRFDRKTETFDSEKIKSIIERLGHKSGDFYLDSEIWQSICRVERGRVSDKMRFAIYSRDNNRCRKCGRLGVFKDLEIDHIFPISKGGKSEPDNLQTLCKSCNEKKSNTVERGAKAPEYMTRGRNELCPMCGAPLLVRRGRYGDFLGCSNYPECRFTKQK